MITTMTSIPTSVCVFVSVETIEQCKLAAAPIPQTTKKTTTNRNNKYHWNNVNWTRIRFINRLKSVEILYLPNYTYGNLHSFSFCVFFFSSRLIVSIANKYINYSVFGQRNPLFCVVRLVIMF